MDHRKVCAGNIELSGTSTTVYSKPEYRVVITTMRWQHRTTVPSRRSPRCAHRSFRARDSSHALSNRVLTWPFQHLSAMEQITSSLAARTATKSTVSGSGSDAAGSVTKRFFSF